MNYIIGYINCKKALKFKKLQKIISYIYFKINVIRIDENKLNIEMNSNKLNKRRIKKIEKTLKTYNINKKIKKNDILLYFLLNALLFTKFYSIIKLVK